MKLLYKGKTKDIYADGQHTVSMLFSDRITTNLQGEVDPGGNCVAETLAPGNGLACLTMTASIFRHLAKKNINTHMVSVDLIKSHMVARKAQLFTPGLEWVARWVATGSFVRRYKSIPKLIDGTRFTKPVFEITLKDDKGQDPLIVPSAIIATNIMPEQELETLIRMNENAMQLIHELFSSCNLDLWDIKLEWGKDAETKALMLIDEISPGCCRAFDQSSRKRVSGADLASRFQNL